MEVVNPKQLTNQARGFDALPLLRQLGLMVGLAGSVALGVAVVLWSQTPNYKMLYNNLSSQDASLVMDALQKSKIDFKMDETSGSVMVASSKVHEARLNLAAQGLPKGTGKGFESMQENQSFGISQFQERAMYNHALEGELARTISSLANVQTARIHIAIPKQTAFVRNRKKPSASVVVNLYAGRSLEKGQVESIVHLVASSVPEMESGQISVIDQKGRLLTSRKNESDIGMSSSQFEYKQKLEEYYSRRIENILTPIIGNGGVRAQVVADLDFTMLEQTQESFNPDLPALRSEQVFEENSNASNQAVGIPGAATNQPSAANGEVLQEGAGAAGSQGSGGSRNQTRRSTLNYELDRTISHTRRSAGDIRRLSIAVVVDDKQSAEGEEIVRTPLKDKELAALTALVKDAIGFNAQRGDTVNVINSAFSLPPQAQELPDIPIWEQAWAWDLAKQIIGGIVVLILAFGVLRPVLRSLAKIGSNVMPDEMMSLQGTAVAGVMPAAAAEKLKQSESYETNMTTAKGMVAQDPKRVAQVVKHWVGDAADE